MAYGLGGNGGEGGTRSEKGASCAESSIHK